MQAAFAALKQLLTFKSAIVVPASFSAGLPASSNACSGLSTSSVSGADSAAADVAVAGGFAASACKHQQTTHQNIAGAKYANKCKLCWSGFCQAEAHAAGVMSTYAGVWRTSPSTCRCFQW